MYVHSTCDYTKTHDSQRKDLTAAQRHDSYDIYDMLATLSNPYALFELVLSNKRIQGRSTG